MALAIVFSRASAGIHAPLVTVETHLSYGTVGFNIVGLPETAVKESRDRVRSALMNTHFEFPVRRITVNLAPADVPKEGSRFDLPIALGILAASGQIPKDILNEYEFVGELALTGSLRAIKGVLPIALAAYQAKRKLIVPSQNIKEAALARHANLFSASHLLDVCAHLTEKKLLEPFMYIEQKKLNTNNICDLSEVKGQAHAKRALEIAATGKHSMLFVGPPGSGKTMLASRLTSILPELSDSESLEVAAIASISQAGFQAENWGKIPFRSPHHTSSSVALVGGGRPPQPGEISLAHKGVLFLDELPEFSRHVLECLREPLESGAITISRAAFQTNFPAHFQLIAAMNPCPCGYAGSLAKECRCSPEQIHRYVGKISGPLLDRIDMHIEMSQVSPSILDVLNEKSGETSSLVRARVKQGRYTQLIRQQKCNTELTVSELDQICRLQSGALHLLQQAMTKFNLSVRVYHRIIKVARSIADLEQTENIEEKHIGEALNYRYLDRAQVLVQ